MEIRVAVITGRVGAVGQWIGLSCRLERILEKMVMDDLGDAVFVRVQYLAAASSYPLMLCSCLRVLDAAAPSLPSRSDPTLVGQEM